MEKKVLVSYEYDRDRRYAEQYASTLNNSNYGSSYYVTKEQLDVRYKGESVVDKYLRELVSPVDEVHVIVGDDTHNAPGVIREIEIAVSQGKIVRLFRIPGTYGGVPANIKNIKVEDWPV